MKKTIAWLVPSLIEGSGGIRVIFNRINALVDDGHECHVYIDEKTGVYELAEQLDRYYGGCRAIIHSGWELERSHDLTVATIWSSADLVSRVTGHKAYLIQDYEAWFHPMSDGYLVAEQSYQLGLTPLPLGRWLPSVLARRFGVPSHFAEFCAETTTYYPKTGVTRDPLSVCFIHQPEKPRRCAQIGLHALELLKQKLPALSIYLFGSRETARLSCDHVNLGILKPAEINDLYNRCSAGLCISSSNPSRIPFEMMASGLPVVDVHRENNLYDFPEEGVILADSLPLSICGALHHILSDPALGSAMSAYGAAYMKQRPMDLEVRQFVASVRRIFDGTYGTSLSPLEPLYRKPPFTQAAA